MKVLKLVPACLALAAVPLAAGCSKSGGAAPAATGPTAGGALPVKAQGRALAFKANAENTSTINSYTNLPQSSHRMTGVAILEKTAAGGIAINGEATEDTNPNPLQGGSPALVSASSPDTLENGTAIAGMKDAKGNVYFEGGNFGDAQASNETANLSSVGVYNIYKNGNFVEQIVMKHGTTIRYQEGVAGNGTAIYAVGYIGNNTTNMPTTGKATYKAFFEGGTSAYDNNGTPEYFGLRDGDVELTADFAKGKVTGGISNATLVDNKLNTLNANVTGLAIDADISGAEYKGTAKLVDAGGNAVGTTKNSEAIGAFFGNNAAETAAAVLIEGTADLGGTSSNYIISGTIGGVKK